MNNRFQLENLALEKGIKQPHEKNNRNTFTINFERQFINNKRIKSHCKELKD